MTDSSSNPFHLFTAPIVCDPERDAVVRRWTREILGLSETDDVELTESGCVDPGCPVRETVVQVKAEGCAMSWRIAHPAGVIVRARLAQVLATKPVVPGARPRPACARGGKREDGSMLSRSSSARLLLASASPRRRELLAELGAVFEVVPAEVVENEDPGLDPRVMVARNSTLKADYVSARYPGDWVLGADTTVFVEGRALNKPADLTEARAMLRLLSGRAHTVFTGVALRHAQLGIREDFGVASEVVFRLLTDALIEDYLSRVHVLDKAGAYAIQEHGELIVAARHGSLSNIIGLPQDEVSAMLRRHGLLGAVKEREYA